METMFLLLLLALIAIGVFAAVWELELIPANPKQTALIHCAVIFRAVETADRLPRRSAARGHHPRQRCLCISWSPQPALRRGGVYRQARARNGKSQYEGSKEGPKR